MIDRQSEYQAWIEAYDTFDDDDFDAMSDLARSLGAGPLVSLLTPVFNTPERLLREAVESVRAQIYENWELCIADDASSAPHVRTILDEIRAIDARIRVVHRASNGGISAASNSALEIAQGS